jgi:hypothetical protein
MSFTEDIAKLRQKFQDAILKGVIAEDGRDIFEATLIQIMNDAEKNRQNCLTQAENLRRQAAVFDGQAGAFASVSSIIYGVLSGFVTLAEKAEQEKQMLADEQSEKEKLIKDALEKESLEKQINEDRSEDKKVSSKKKRS